MSQRIKQLEKFMEEDSSDPFIHYALALEYAKVDQQKAIDTLLMLLQANNDYLPTYYQLAKLYEGVGQTEKSMHIFTAGIALAKKKNDLKTAGELQSALDEMKG
jgi:tetratricopeptide (TPR) repeat protein